MWRGGCRPMVAFLLVSIGGGCEPEPTCDGSACSENEHRVCIDLCEVPAREHEQCDRAPCDLGLPSCAQGLSCVRVDQFDRTFECRDLDKVLFAECDPFLDAFGVETCSTGLFCRPSYCTDSPPNVPRGSCAQQRRDGSRCDADVGQAGCEVCAAGLECVDDETTGDQRCRRFCNADADCACEQVCLEAQGFCADCVGAFGPCSREVECCDGLICSQGVCLPGFTESDDSCSFNRAGCAPCVADVRERLSDVYQGGRAVNSFQFPLRDPISAEHVQGIARLPDIVDGTWDGWVPGSAAPIAGRLVVTHNENDHTNPGLWVLLQQSFVGPAEQYPQTWRDGSWGFAETSVDVMDTGLNHPGGLQAMGTTVAVAIECGGCDLPAEVRFLEFGDDFDATLVNAFSLGDDPLLSFPERSAASVAVTRLRTGHYLMFVAAQDHGRAGGTFYISDRAALVSETVWHHVSSWVPPCTERRSGCWAGASNMTFLTDCGDLDGGNLFLVATHGQHDIAGYPGNFVTLAKLRRGGAEEQRIELDLEEMLRPRTARTRGLDVSYRWAGNFFVTPFNTLSSDVSERNPSREQLEIQTLIPPGAHSELLP